MGEGGIERERERGILMEEVSERCKVRRIKPTVGGF